MNTASDRRLGLLQELVELYEHVLEICPYELREMGLEVEEARIMELEAELDTINSTHDD